MKLQNVIHIVIGFICVWRFYQRSASSRPATRRRLSKHSPRQKGNKAFKASPPALQTRQLVGIRSGATQRGASTPLRAPERCFSTRAEDNTAFGAAALLFNSTGANNTAVGAATFLNNTIRRASTPRPAAFALSGNTEGDFNTANGAFCALGQHHR